MLFPTWTFVVFLAVVFAAFHLVPGTTPRRAMVQVVLLTVASMVFYGFHLPWLVILLVFSLAVNGWVAARLLREDLPPRSRRAVLIAGLAANLGALGFFKYAALLADTLLPAGLAESLVPHLHQIPLPVGISFYTFQGLSLVLDCYWGRKEGMESLLRDRDAPGRFQAKVWFYISFFPQLVAGPIIKAHDFVNQIGSKTLHDIDWRDATRKLILGFFLKMVVADNLKEITDSIEFPAARGLSGATHLVFLYGFSFQIFADFAGYSLIAMGLGRLFGYRFPLNFNFPYLSRSITEFWRRWHISLSTWLRDYLYIPLGGNRMGSGRTYVNLFLVMFLGGLWHGAAWSYAIWGMAHGVLLAIERALGVGRDRGGRAFHPALAWPLAVFRVLLIFNLVSFLWLLFKLPHFPDVVEYMKSIGRGGLRVPPQTAYVFLLFSAPVILYHLWGAMDPVKAACRKCLGAARYQVLESAVLGFLLFLIVVNSGSTGAFIYFQF